MNVFKQTTRWKLKPGRDRRPRRDSEQMSPQLDLLVWGQMRVARRQRMGGGIQRRNAISFGFHRENDAELSASGELSRDFYVSPDLASLLEP
jgi:hypothetical protein